MARCWKSTCVTQIIIRMRSCRNTWPNTIRLIPSNSGLTRKKRLHEIPFVIADVPALVVAGPDKAGQPLAALQAIHWKMVGRIGRGAGQRQVRADLRVCDG